MTGAPEKPTPPASASPPQSAGGPGAADPGDLNALLRRTAALARLDLTDDEAKEMAGQFGRILDQFQALADLDVADVEPTRGRATGRDVTRPDKARPSLEREKLMERAPETTDGFYGVPKTVHRPDDPSDNGATRGAADA